MLVALVSLTVAGVLGIHAGLSTFRFLVLILTVLVRMLKKEYEKVRRGLVTLIDEVAGDPRPVSSAGMPMPLRGSEVLPTDPSHSVELGP